MRLPLLASLAAAMKQAGHPSQGVAEACALAEPPSPAEALAELGAQDDSDCFVGEWKHLSTDLGSLESYLRNVADQSYFVIRGSKSVFPSLTWTKDDSGFRERMRINVYGYKQDEMTVMPAVGTSQKGGKKIGSWNLDWDMTTEWARREVRSFVPLEGAELMQHVFVTTATVAKCEPAKFEGKQFVVQRWVDEWDRLHAVASCEHAPGETERFERIFERVSGPGLAGGCRPALVAPVPDEDEEEEAQPSPPPVEQLPEAAGLQHEAEPRGCDASEVCCKGGKHSVLWVQKGFYQCVQGTGLPEACTKFGLRMKEKRKCDPSAEALAAYRARRAVAEDFARQRAEQERRLAAQRAEMRLPPAPAGVPEVLGASAAFDGTKRGLAAEAVQQQFLTDAATVSAGVDPASSKRVVEDAMSAAVCDMPAEQTLRSAAISYASGALQAAKEVTSLGLVPFLKWGKWLRSVAGACWQKVWNWKDGGLNNGARLVAVGHLTSALSP